MRPRSHPRVAFVFNADPLLTALDKVYPIALLFSRALLTLMLQPFRFGMLFLWLFVGCRETPRDLVPGARAVAEIRFDTGETVVFGKGMDRKVQPLTGTPRIVREMFGSERMRVR